MHLIQDHDDLRQIMQVFAREMSATPPDMAQIARRRIDFSQLFRQHMGTEDAMVGTLARQSKGPRVGQIIDTHRNGMRDLFLRYSAHIKAWTPDRITADWSGYRVAVLALQSRLKDRMAWEEKMLYPLKQQAA